MQCNRCGHELNDGDKFCPKCGYPVDVIEVNTEGEVVTNKRVTFKDSVAALFSKTFTFDGKTTRREFNYTVIFLYLISMVITWIAIGPTMSELPETASTAEMLEYIMNQLSSTDYSSPWNVAMLATSVMYTIFLAAPIYRRAFDIFGNKSTSTAFVAVFVLGQVLSQGIVISLMGEFYTYLELFITILSLGSLFVLFSCMLRRSKR